MELSGLEKEFYTTRKRDFDEFLPWQIIDSSVSTDFLRLEAERALAETVTPDCRYGCAGCGINRRVTCEACGILAEKGDK